MSDIHKRLNDAAKEGKIDRIYELIKEDPNVLEHFEKIPFVETPLHVAASAGNLEFAAEIMRLKPSFALKPDEEGWCPIHRAIKSAIKSRDKINSKRMVLHFIKINSDLVRVKGKEGFTPLHFVIKFLEKPDVDLLTKFLEVCPDSIEEVTVRSETALHIAIQNEKHDAVQSLRNWFDKKCKDYSTVLNWDDVEGNTILHISAKKNDKKSVEWLLKKREKLKVKAKNLDGKTASGMASDEYIKRKLVEAENKATEFQG